MSYTDLKITDTDNNKEVANKINTTLDQLNVEIPKKLEADSYIKADDIKAYYIIDYNTKQVTPEFIDHTTTGVFKLCDPVALQEALKNPNTEENIAFLTSVAYIMHSLVFSNPDVLYDKDFEVIGNNHDINHFLRYYTDTLLSREPLVYKNIVKVDDTTNRVIDNVSLNGMVRYNRETCVNAETGNKIGQDTYTIYPINPTIRNTVYDIITSFLNKYVEGEHLTRLTTAFNNIFKIPNIRDIETTNSLIQPAFNAEGMLVYGIYLWNNIFTDVVEFYAENMEYTKADLHKIIETGTNIIHMWDTGAGTSTIHINGKEVEQSTGLQHIGRLNNYTLLVNIKCSDGNLCYFSLVKSNFIVVLTERLDNYAPYMFGLDFFLIPTVNQPQYIKNSVKYSGYINLLSNPTIVIYAPKSNSEYLSNTVIMGMDPDSVDDRMILGVHNVVYPSIDLSDRPVSETEGSLNVLVSYNSLAGVEGGITNKPELGFIRGNYFKAANSTRLEGKEYIFTTKEEYDANMAAGTINNENVYLIPEIESASGSFAVRSINGIYPDGTGNIYIDKLGKSSIEVKQVTIVGALANTVSVIPIPKNDNFAGLPLEVLKFVERAGTTVIMGGEMKLTNVEDFNITGGITLTDTAAMLNNTVKISSSSRDECLIDLSVLMQYEDWRIG